MNSNVEIGEVSTVEVDPGEVITVAIDGEEVMLKLTKALDTSNTLVDSISSMLVGMLKAKDLEGVGVIIICITVVALSKLTKLLIMNWGTCVTTSNRSIVVDG